MSLLSYLQALKSIILYSGNSFRNSFLHNFLIELLPTPHLPSKPIEKGGLWFLIKEKSI